MNVTAQGPARWRVLGGAVLATASIALTACGGSDSGDSGTQAASGGKPYDITTGEFVAAVESEKNSILKAYVADTPSCDAELKDDRFVLAVSAGATNYPDSTQLTKVLPKYC